MTGSSDSPLVLLPDDAIVLRLHARAAAARWGVAPARFARALSGALASRFAGALPDDAAVERFLETLHLEELALAVGCADGSEPAWDCFAATHRAELRRAATAIAGADRADDLCDALLGELFGVDARGRARASLFGYFHGRSRLSTWLRAVLAQRHVDLLRVSRRTVPLESDEQADELMPPVMPATPDPDRARLVAALQRALDDAIAALDAQERLRLVCYHVDGMTLAEMGRLFREHEATASRKLTRIRTRVREAVEAGLQRDGGLDAAQARLAFDYALEDGGIEFAALSSPSPGGMPAPVGPVSSAVAASGPGALVQAPAAFAATDIAGSVAASSVAGSSGADEVGSGIGEPGKEFAPDRSKV